MSGDEGLRALAEAEGSRGWFKVDFNEGDDPAYRPLWGVSNDAYFNPPAAEDEPWLAVEIHTGTEATAAFIAAANPTVVLGLLDRLAATEAACGICENHARIQALIERSSLGDDEAKAARESVPNEVGTAIALAAGYLRRATDAEAAVEHWKATCVTWSEEYAKAWEAGHAAALDGQATT